MHNTPNSRETFSGLANSLYLVNLFTTVASDKPLFLDFTPPIAGTVWDGSTLKTQTNFTFADTSLAANWNGFYDPESGIDMYRKFPKLNSG